MRLEVGDGCAEGGGSRLLLVWRILSSGADLCMVLPSGYDVISRYPGVCAVYVNGRKGRTGRRSVTGGRNCIPETAARCDVLTAWVESRRTLEIVQRARRGFARFVTYLAAVSVPPAHVQIEQVEQKQKWRVSAGMRIVEGQTARRGRPVCVRVSSEQSVRRRCVLSVRAEETSRERAARRKGGWQTADSRQQASASNGCSGN